MRTLILFYSRTGHTRRVAELLAERLAATPAEITCGAYSPGLGALRQPFDVLLGLSPPIEVPELATQDWDLVIIGGPVWGARPAPPLRSYLRRCAASHRQMAIFVTCNGTSRRYPPERAIAEMTALAPTRPIASHIFTEAHISGPDLAVQAAMFQQELGVTS